LHVPQMHRGASRRKSGDDGGDKTSVTRS
jgi:hypothetical protein